MCKLRCAAVRRLLAGLMPCTNPVPHPEWRITKIPPLPPSHTHTLSITQRRSDLLGVVPGHGCAAAHAARPVIGIAPNVVAVPEGAAHHAITPFFFSRVVEVVTAVEDGSEAVGCADGGAGGLACWEEGVWPGRRRAPRAQGLHTAMKRNKLRRCTHSPMWPHP